MSESLSWNADINVRIDAARTEAELKSITAELRRFGQSLDQSDENIKMFATTSKRLNTAVKETKAGLRDAGFRFQETYQDAKQFFNLFKQNSVANVGKGSLDGMGLGRMREEFAKNETEIRRFVASYDALETKGVTAARKIVAETDKIRQAQEKANAAANAKVTQSESTFNNAAALAALERRTALMGKAEAATERVVAAERALTTATTARIAAENRGDKEGYAAARKAEAAALVQVERASARLAQAKNAEAVAQQKATAAAREALVTAKANASAADIASIYERQNATLSKQARLTRDLAAAQREAAATKAIAGSQTDPAAQAAALDRVTAATQRATATERQLNTEREKSAKSLAAARDLLAASENKVDYAKTANEAGGLAAAEERLARATRDRADAYSRLKAAQGTENEAAATKAAAAANRELAVAQRAVAQATGASTTSIESQRYALYEMGAAYTLAAATLFRFGKSIVSTFSELELQLAHVSRTTGLAGGEFQILQDQLVRMGDRIGTPIEEINNMAIAAGQLGIAKEEIAGFTEAVSKFVAISDTVTARDAAEALGRLANLTGTKGQWDALASSIAHVGVNAAATDQQIIQTAQEVAQAAAGANFAADEIIGLSAAFASLGVPPERARSVMNDLVKVMTKGMAEGSGAVEVLGRMFGKTTDEISAMWRANPTGLFQDMVKAMSGMSEVDMFNTLQEMGLKGARAVPVLQALAKDARSAGEGLSVLDRSIGDAKLGLDNPELLENQFSKMTETMAASWERFMNTMKTLGMMLGTSVGPALKGLLDVGQQVGIVLRDMLSNDVVRTIAGFVIAVTSWGTAMMAFRGAAYIATAQLLAFRTAATAAGVGGLASNLKTLAGAFLGLATSAKTAEVATTGSFTKASAGAMGMSFGVSKAGAAMSKFGSVASGVVGALGGPWVVGIAAAVGALMLLDNSLKVSGASMQDVVGNIEKAATASDVMVAAMARQDGMMDAFGNWDHPFDRMRAAVGNSTQSIVDNQAAIRELGGTTERAKAKSQEYTRTMADIDHAARKTGEALASMSETDIPGSAQAFMKLTEGMNYTETQMVDLLDATEAYKKAMYEQGKAAGVITADMNTYEGKVQTLNYIQGQAVQAGGDFNQNLWEQGEAAGAAGDYIKTAADALRDYTNAAWAATDSSFAYYEALKKASEVRFEEGSGAVVLDSSGFIDPFASLDIEKATAAKDALKELQGAMYENAAAAFETDGSYANLMTNLNNSKAEFIAQADAMGFSTEEAKRLADAYFGIPEEIAAEIVTNGTVDAANMSVTDLKAALEQVPPDTTVTIQNASPETLEELKATGYEVTQLDGQTATITTGSNATDTTQDVAGTQAATEQLDGSAANVTTSSNAPQQTNFLKDMWRALVDLNGMTAVSSVITKYISQFFTEDYSSGSGGGDRRRGKAEGGYTGSGAKYEPKGVYHGGEYIFPKRDVDQSTGLPKQDALGRLMTQSPAPVLQLAGGGSGGNGGIVELGPTSLNYLAAALSKQNLNIDGETVSKNSAKHYGAGTRQGAN